MGILNLVQFTTKIKGNEKYHDFLIMAVSSGHGFIVTLDDFGNCWMYGTIVGESNSPVIKCTIPTIISDLQNINIISISCGTQHVLLCDTNGKAYSFGVNTFHQLGYSTDSIQTTPQQIPKLEDIVIVEAGKNFSLCVDSNGDVFGFGSNMCSQLGSGLCNRNITSPTRIPRLSGITKACCGDYHSLFLDSEGMVYGCGQSYYGQLGYGGKGTQTHCFEIKGLPKISDIVGGTMHSLFLSEDGELYGCGSNCYGQLSMGEDEEDAYTVTKILLPDEFPYPVRRIFAGEYHSAVNGSDYSLWTFGKNNNRQLGLVSKRTKSNLCDNRYIAQHAKDYSDVLQVSCGGNHTILQLSTGITVLGVIPGEKGSLTNFPHIIGSCFLQSTAKSARKA